MVPWIAASSAGSASLINFNYTATASQTTFSGADDNSRTLSYTVDNLIVTRNGVVLEDGTDYTATNGTSIVLAVAATAGDEINVVAFESFTTADMVSATNGGTFQNNVTVNGTMTATAFSGDGSALTNLPAAGISDVVQDTTPQLGGNLDTNGNNITFADNDKAVFGAGSDLQIYHDGLNSRIADAGTGDLKIGTSGGAVRITANGVTDDMIVANQGGSVSLSHSGSTKLATTASGCDITGGLNTTGSVGIGTVLPSVELEIASSAPQMRITDTDTNAVFQINASSTTGGVELQADATNVGSNPFMAFDVGGSEAIRILDGGSVGIGTISPAFVTGSGLEIERAGAATLRLEDTGSGGKPLEIYSDDGEGYVINGVSSGMPMIFKNNNSERLRITSTGKVETTNRDYGFINHGTQVSLADDASIVINAVTAGGGILAIYETASGQWAVFGVGYAGASIMSALNSSNFDVIDTDGRICVIPSGHTITIKNRFGGTKAFYINMFMAGNDFAG